MAITFINSTGLTIGTAASTWSIATPSSMHGGAMFAVVIGTASSLVTIASMTDNTTNVYQVAVSRNGLGPANVGVHLWYCMNGSSLSTRISVTLSTTSSGAIGFGQWNGVSTANALGVINSSAVQSNSTSHGAAEITPITDNQVVISAARLNASTIGTITNLGGMTTWLSTANFARMHCMYIIQTTASTCTGSFTTSSNCQHCACIAAFSDTFVVPPFSYAPTNMMMGYGY